MKVRLTVVLSESDRFVIAKYFGTPGRGTRKQSRQFIAGAVRSAVRTHTDALRGRHRATAKRLRDGKPQSTEPELKAPAEKQLSLLDGAL